MQNCKLYVFTQDELKIIQCRSDNPASFVADAPMLTDELIQNSVFMRFEWYDSDIRHCISVTVKSFNGQTAVFSPESEVRRQTSEQYHLIDLSEPVEVIRINESEIMDYRVKADAVNGRSRNSLTSQIKQILLDETVTNQIILKMLVQIDSKLDELLSIKRADSMPGLKSTRLICLSGAGACFVADNAAEGDYFYIQSVASVSSAGFAVIGRVINTIPTEKGFICETEFIGIDETTREGLIRIVFDKDREKLKRKKLNG